MRKKCEKRARRSDKLRRDEIISPEMIRTVIRVY